ncbi:MAG: peptide chain release factor N(5)-glutamine methyltransferase [Atopococcus tabaci]|uniref:Release factor glutamine methyltransferase n=1 Tax=Atopococcus tabaci TaxID=269774 RepID=A0AA43ZSS1_9LACT|nr:peptide chain release factor N(5)-glutamine methyltransferase [Atopococcus tabaci]
MDSKAQLQDCQSIQEVLDRASSFLEQNRQETYIARWLLRERFDISQMDIILNKKRLTPENLSQLEEDLEQAAEDYPVQYIVGHSWFYGRSFKVDERVLIPRPETEEMVDLILKNHDSSNQDVLDIGTGSGVIAVSLMAERPCWNVTASDISQGALDLAAKNARNLDTHLNFVKSDLFNNLKDQKYDLIVSNPPYISPEEWDIMGHSVRKYEPKLALFAESNGLAVYEKLARELPFHLNKKGQVYLEIGYTQGSSVRRVMQEAFPGARVEIIQDLAAKDRIIHVEL